MIKKLIKKTNFKNRKRVDDLINIELYVTGKISSLSLAYKVNRPEEKYSKEFKAIYLELNPKGFKQHLKRKKLKRQEKKRLEEWNKKEIKKEFQESKSEWKKAGGKTSRKTKNKVLL